MVQLSVLMEDFVRKREKLILILLKQTQNFGWAGIIILTIVICLLVEKKSSCLKPTMSHNHN